MASAHSYTITRSNNATEKQGIRYVTESDSTLIEVDTKTKKEILKILGIDNKFLRSFDLIKVNGVNILSDKIELKFPNEITLIELKTTQKKLVNFPKGFFFGATENEFELAQKLGDQYKFCFVSLHEETTGFELLTLNELESIIKNKRIQYQINL